MIVRIAVVALAMAVGLAAVSAASARPAEPSRETACAAKQKLQRTKALASYRKAMPKQRAAYFRKHRSKKQRAAFVRKQKARLKALQKALAACSKKSTQPTPARPVSDLSVTKTVVNDGLLRYTLTVRNAGPSPAGARLTDPLPAGLELVSAGGSRWSCSGTATVDCTYDGLLEVGASAVVTIVTRPLRTGAFSNTAGVTTTNLDRNPRNDYATAIAEIEAVPPPPAGAQADLGVTLSAAYPALTQWNKQRYTAVVTNKGPSVAAGVTLTHVLPAEIAGPTAVPSATVISIVPSRGTCTRSTEPACALGNLGVGESATITLVLRLQRAGDARMSAYVSSPTPDPSAADNLTNVVTSVADAPAVPAAVSGPGCSPSLTPGAGTFHSEGPTDYGMWLRPSGELRAVMIFVDFPDAEQAEATTDLHALLVPEAQVWFANVSSGAMSLSVAPRHQWYRMPKPSSAYGFSDGLTFDEHRAYIVDALAAAAEVDFAGYQILYVVSSKGAAIPVSPAFHAQPGSGVTADGNELRHAATFGADIRTPIAGYGAHVLEHETLHMFDLPDLYEVGVPTFPDFLRFVGGWDPMSWVAPGAHPLAWHKWKLGWLGAGAIRCLDATGTLAETLTPLAVPGGVKALVLKTGPSTAYVVEAREPLGKDAGLCDNGVLVYFVDATISSGAGPIRLRGGNAPPEPLEIARCGPRLDAPLDTGPIEVATYEDKQAGVKVEVLAATPEAYRVRVTR
ncbi:MAG: hypothetical protein ABR583_02895 [Gaiellaceae bacterium]